MRWPWVSWARFDAMAQLVEAWRQDASKMGFAYEDLRKDAAAERARHDALLEKYHALRAAGASPPPPALTPAPRPSQPSDLAIEEVVERFGGSARLRRRLQKEQGKMRAGGDDEATIAHAIKHWRDPEDDEGND